MPRIGQTHFCFHPNRGGNLEEQGIDDALKVALDQFKNEIDAANVLVSYFDNSDKLQTEVLVSIQKWNDEGRPGARLVFTTPNEFFAPYRVAGVPRLFDFAQVLRGRTTEMEALTGYLASADLVVGVLSGRGGIGKSKLLHDWTAAIGAETTGIMF